MMTIYRQSYYSTIRSNKLLCYAFPKSNFYRQHSSINSNFDKSYKWNNTNDRERKSSTKRSNRYLILTEWLYLSNKYRICIHNIHYLRIYYNNRSISEQPQQRYLLSTRVCYRQRGKYGMTKLWMDFYCKCKYIFMSLMMEQ